MLRKPYVALICAALVAAVFCEFANAATRRATWPRYKKAYTVTSYEYKDTTVTPNLCFQALAAPCGVPVGPGAPVVKTFCPPFTPNKIIIQSHWNNAPAGGPTQWVMAGPDGKFTWTWTCIKRFGKVTICESPDMFVICEDPDFQCSGGDGDGIGSICKNPIDPLDPDVTLFSDPPPEDETVRPKEISDSFGKEWEIVCTPCEGGFCLSGSRDMEDTLGCGPLKMVGLLLDGVFTATTFGSSDNACVGAFWRGKRRGNRIVGIVTDELGGQTDFVLLPAELSQYEPVPTSEDPQFGSQ